MNKTPIQEAADFLGRYDSYYLIGHKEPDGDCVGSQLALASFLKRHGKEAFLVSAGPFAKVEIAPYAPLFAQGLPQNPGSTAACVILDCSSISRTGSVADTIPAGMPIAFIDHHDAGQSMGDVLCIDTSAPAVAYLVQLVMEAAADGPNQEEAQFLLFGIRTDTGFFRHLDDGSASVFEAVSRLVAVGASPKKAFAMMNGGKSFESRQFMGLLLGRAELHYGGRLISTYAGPEDLDRFSLVSRDSDMLYQLLMTVEGVEAVFVVRQESLEDCTVGFRSKERIDVAALARSFGGGGHRLAAGLHIRGNALALKATIVDAFKPVFDAIEL
ncbi:MAG TPA: bifunctional oligoribonuclease/PAP phosphatase NrnA [Spirochaetales bacterium]|nr:bifunctional oligoribonuclease/PAP phosphatase NrnA [Spirochaetales bacterium]